MPSREILKNTTAFRRIQAECIVLRNAETQREGEEGRKERERKKPSDNENHR